MFAKYSFLNTMKEFNNNKQLITAWMKNESVEGMTHSKKVDSHGKPIIMIAGMDIKMFIVLFIFHLALFVWAVVSLFQNWNLLPSWAQLVAVLALLGPLGGPVISLLVVYIARQDLLEGMSFRFY